MEVRMGDEQYPALASSKRNCRDVMLLTYNVYSPHFKQREHTYVAPRDTELLPFKQRQVGGRANTKYVRTTAFVRPLCTDMTLTHLFSQVRTLTFVKQPVLKGPKITSYCMYSYYGSLIETDPWVVRVSRLNMVRRQLNRSTPIWSSLVVILFITCSALVSRNLESSRLELLTLKRTCPWCGLIRSVFSYIPPVASRRSPTLRA